MRDLVRAGLSFAALASVLGLGVPRATAQHEGHGTMPAHDGHDGTAAHEGRTGTEGTDMEHRMEPKPSPGAATSRDSSGTGWLPDSSPMHAIHAMAGGWRLMFHGHVYAGVNWQGSTRGDSEPISTNWIMGMASRDLAGGELTLRGMFSLEPLTVGKDGYSLLLQSGEAYQGRPLVDRQHPHDLFMELAAHYRHPIGGGLSVDVYGGPVAEPALGPAAFPHRPSAMPNPLAPLGHHWFDSTHISMGVVTAGVSNRYARLEGSWFNGREPDEDRYDIEFRGFDSYATRLSIAPHRDVSLQASYGFLKSPEQLEPDVSVGRFTTSATYNRPIGMTGNWATTAAWGRNMPDEGSATNAFFIESALDADKAGTPFLRLELVEKAGHDLALGEAMAEEVFTVHNASAGYLYELPAMADLRPGVGVVGTLTHLPDATLAAAYGNDTLFGAMAYVTIRPTRPATTMHH